MYNIIPLFLMLISLIIIISIVVRKFPVLASLDVNTIQAEREAKFKEQIISKRLKRSYLKYYFKIINLIKPAGSSVSDFFKYIYKKLVEFKENYNKQENVKVDIFATIEKLFTEIDDATKNENQDLVEQKYIKIIGFDSKNIKAFKGLGKLYHDRKDYNESKQTFEHALRLLEKELETQESNGTGGENLKEQLSEIYYFLCLVAKDIENFDGSLLNIDKALEIQPNNPRYLDVKLEISIIKKDKNLALEVYEKLAETNPENKKLEELKKKIDEI
jgi:tetratricopeptide (TPR) repeat protein